MNFLFFEGICLLPYIRQSFDVQSFDSEMSLTLAGAWALDSQVYRLVSQTLEEVTWPRGCSVYCVRSLAPR